MIVEIRKAGFVNKGAEMMLLSIIEQIAERYPDATLVMAPTTERGSQPFSKIARLGFRSKFRLRRGKIDLSWVGMFIPAKIRNAYGIVLDTEIDIVLDASGFSYSDQWGTYDCEELKDAIKKGKKYQQKFILLPQAFGPFDMKSNVDNIKKAVENADLVFARDSVSLAHLTGVFDKPLANLLQKPDFTCNLKPIIDVEVKSKKGMVPIVPNYRMLDKTDETISGAYIEALKESVSIVIEKGLTPYFLIHETALDKEIALKIISSLDAKDIVIIEENDPRIIKGYLGTARFVISSRYHATVSALSQCVPVVGTSWSHKYEELFSEYDYIEGLCSIDQFSDLKNLITKLSLDETHSEVVKILQKNSQKVKNDVLDMWQNVFSVIDRIE